MTTAVDDHHRVWVLLVERDIRDGANLHLFHDETSATKAAHRYLRKAWVNGHKDMPANVYEAIEQYNQGQAYGEEHILLSPWAIESH
ncbi:hypothetical protein [Candidatus Poriferisocius sp.]|uniref:hypothetical protein n=1 Tax=Candidatus Poriferisocius sp. TaxID=3101276 RepID=UPI003B017D83